ncbi:MAG: MFS transporter [Chloroflexi bacterium]|nr:MFS transporter [Chloroflexota bacterium]
MIKKRRFPRVFFGWWTVLASGLVGMWATGYSAYGFSALFKPIATELGFSRAVTSVASSIGRLEGGIEGPVVGGLTDKFGPKWLVLFGIFLMGLGLILMNFISSLWAFYIVWGVMVGTGSNVGAMAPWNKALTEWFVRKRGKALGVREVFRGHGGVVVLPLIAWLIVTQGWRRACVIGGVVLWLVGLPFAWFFLKRHRPEYYGLLPDGARVEAGLAGDDSHMIDRGVDYAAEVEEVEFTLRQAMRTPSFWLLIIAQGGYAFAQAPITVHLIPFLTDRGIEPFKAAGMLAMMAFVSIPTRLAGGLIQDRVKKEHLRFLLVGTYLLQAVAISVFLLDQSIAMIYVWFILRGISMGAGFVLTFPLRARYFGRKAFGSITGFSTMFLTPLEAAAPIYIGWVYDTTDSYIRVFTLVAVVVAIAAVLMSLTKPPQPPARITDVREFL